MWEARLCATAEREPLRTLSSIFGLQHLPVLMECRGERTQVPVDRNEPLLRTHVRRLRRREKMKSWMDQLRSAATMTFLNLSLEVTKKFDQSPGEREMPMARSRESTSIPRLKTCKLSYSKVGH